MSVSTIRVTRSVLAVAALACGWRAILHRHAGPAEEEARALLAYHRDTLIGFQVYDSRDPKIAERMQNPELRQIVVDTL